MWQHLRLMPKQPRPPDPTGTEPSDRTVVQRFRVSQHLGDLPARLAAEAPQTVPNPQTDPESMLNLTSAPLHAVAAEDTAVLPLATGARYQSGERLGMGGMGEVVHVHDHSLQRDVAMKVLRPELANRPEYVNALRREARIIGGLEHPAIIPVYELGVQADGGTYYTKIGRAHV